MSSNTEAAVNLQHKLELYLVGLAFTLSGFAIETGKFSGNWCGDIFEVISWIAFISSGLIGISRLDEVVIVLRNWDVIKKTEADIDNTEMKRNSKKLFLKT